MKSIPKIIFTTFVFIGFTPLVQAQSTIHGLVVDATGQPVPQANVLLLHATDSALVKGMVTNTSGTFSFTNIPAGTYLIAATFTGFQQVYTAPFTTTNSTNKNAGTLTLTPEE